MGEGEGLGSKVYFEKIQGVYIQTYIYIYMYVCYIILGVARYMYSYQTATVWTSQFGAWGLTTNTGNSPPTRSNATLFDNRQRRQKNSEYCELRACSERVYHMDWRELCARVSYLSHSAQIQIFHDIFIFAM